LACDCQANAGLSVAEKLAKVRGGVPTDPEQKQRATALSDYLVQAVDDSIERFG